MKRTLRIVWLIFAFVLLGFHLLQGRKIDAYETANSIRELGAKAESAGKYDLALRKFTEAIKVAEDADRSLQVRLQLDAARVGIQAGESLGIAETLDALIESEQATQLPKTLLRETRSLAASAHYYAAYALRLESAPRDMWLDEIERSRQHLRTLAENAANRSNHEEADTYGQALESAIRLERAGVFELNSKQIPKPCENARKKGIFKKKCEQCDKKNGKRSKDEKEEKPGNSMKRFDPGQGS